MPPYKKTRKSKTCRICMRAKTENRVTFDVESEWSRLLNFCFGINSVTSGPRVLCEACSTKLKEYSEFKTLALKSDSFWNNLLADNIIKVKNDPIETIVIKDEDYSDNNIDDTEYLGWEVQPDIEIKEDICQDQDINFKDEIIKEEVKVESDELINSDLPKQELSEKQFIKKFFSKIELKRGRWKVKYQCIKCGDTYARRSALSPHIEKCYDSQVFLMKKKSEVTKVHVAPVAFYCGLCEFSSAEDKEATEHFNGHIAQNDFNCKLCEYIGRDAADVVAHRYVHMPSEYDYKLHCPACNKLRMNILSLQFHYRATHLNKAGGWCSVCSKTFTGYKYFRNHERLHKSAKFICDFCGMKFLFRNLIITHLKEHMNIRNYVCDTCGRSFKRNNALTGHIRAYHMENKAVTCEHCGKKFKNQYNLNLHMKTVRKGKNFICDVCSKGYPSLNMLQKHMFWHTGERPYACETCGSRYKAKGALKIHMRKHNGYFPYKCELCEKQFISSNQLKVHTSVHTGIRRVKCLVCDKTFHEKKRMLEHCQSKHESVIVKLENQLVVV